MSELVFAAVMPHGYPLIPDLSPDADGALATRQAMEEVGRRCTAAQPDVIIVATPHGTRVEGAICLAAAPRAQGILRFHRQQVEMNVPVDLALTDAIARQARARHIPVALANLGGNRRDQSIATLDWGSLIPLWFLGHGRNMAGHGDLLADPPPLDFGPPVIIAAPSQSLRRSAMIDFGRAAAEAAAQDGRRVAFVASCDWAHTHSATGPYGFHPAAAQVDAVVVQALREGAPGKLINLDESLMQSVVLDGVWQTLMLAGAMERAPMHGSVLCYEAPAYYGMIVACFLPAA